MDSARDETVYGIIGFVMFGIIVAGLGWGIYSMFDWVAKLGDLDVTVAIGFEPDTEQPASQFVQISGSVWSESGPADEGIVRVEVTRADPPLSFAIPATIEQGRFVVARDPALRTVSPVDTLEVTATATMPAPDDDPEGSSLPLTGVAEAHYSQRGAIGLSFWWVAAIVLLVIYLGWIYTGPQTGVKNRLQVVTAYIAILFALVLPILAPFALVNYPQFAEKVALSPVGVLRAHKVGNDDDGSAGKVSLNQWAFHIGGIPRRVEDEPSAPPPADTTAITYDLQGGIVVPLYVIVLSLLGGAVNMTRAIPRLQNDLDAAIAATRPLEVAMGLSADLMRRLSPGRSRAKGEQEESTGTAIDTDPVREEPVDTGEQPAAEDRQASGEESAPAGDANKSLIGLRRELIVQYMYLIVAPVLAIVTYYLLFMMEQRLVQSVPIVVLISFASGLLSETVLGTISTKAEQYLERLKNPDAASGGGS